MRSERELYEHFWAYSAQRPVINTHCHLLPEAEFAHFDLEKLLRNSYLNWCGFDWEDNPASRQDLFEKVRLRSAFTWLQKSLQSMYQSDRPLSAGTWEDWSGCIASAHAEADFRRKLLQEFCGYRRLILDAYWQPGSDNQDPALFSPAFRVNSFFFGYALSETDHDGNNPYRLYPRPFILELEAYLDWLRETVRLKRSQGCVALKVPIAYDRGLDFKEVSHTRASQVFASITRRFASLERPAETSPAVIHGENLPSNSPSTGTSRAVELGIASQDVKDFQDYLFFQVCQVAAELKMPLQVHTGTGQGKNTNALCLLETIQKNPDTQFVLLHCSYPWIQDASYLASRFPNVHADLSMLPLFSSQAAGTVLEELIEGVNSHKAAWGCDTWTPEESYAALLALRHVLAWTLASRIANGYFDQEAAEFLIDNILYHNPKQLYGLQDR